MGRDPAWHPTKSWLIYAGARLSGRKITGYDLRVTNLKTPGKWQLHTQHSDERYPNWYPGSRKIIYTKMRTTDLYWLRIKKKIKVLIKILPRKSYLCITHLFFAVCNLNASSLQAYEKSILPLQEGQPLEHDITLLKPYFKPTIGDFIYLRNVRTDQSKKMEQLEGSILVSPPKTTASQLKKSLDEPDVIVCEPKEVAFKLTNIDPEGRVRWIIKTGKVSTPVTWPTRYRIGKVVDLKMKWPGRAKRIAVLDCKVVRNSTSGRRVYVKSQVKIGGQYLFLPRIG